jgi:hypothetical protein
MGRRKGGDNIASKKRRMPYVAKIKRDDPFCPEDEREIEAMCRRIAAAGEFMVLAGWREDAGFRVFHFPTWAKARAMQHWIDRSGIAVDRCQSPMTARNSVRAATRCYSNTSTTVSRLLSPTA